MKSTLLLLILGCVLVSGIVFTSVRLNKLQKKIACTPTFADGDGPYYKVGVPHRSRITPPDYPGAPLIVRGRVLKNDCDTPVRNTILDIWQASDFGDYDDEWFRGKITTDTKGNYEFTTVMPLGYGEGTAKRPPHIHFKVWDGEYLIITSEMFFPEVKGRPGFEDAYIMKLETETKNGMVVHRGYHDIILP